MTGDDGNTGKTIRAIRYQSQQHITRSYSSNRHFVFQVPRARHLVSVLYTLGADRLSTASRAAVDGSYRECQAPVTTLVQLSQQQQAAAAEAAQRTGTYRTISTLARDLRRYAKRMSISRRYLFTFWSGWIRIATSRCGEHIPLEGVSYITSILTADRSKNMSQTWQEQQQNNKVVVRV